MGVGGSAGAADVQKEVYGELEVPKMFEVPPSEPWPERLWGMELGEIKMVDGIRSSENYVRNDPERWQWLDSAEASSGTISGANGKARRRHSGLISARAWRSGGETEFCGAVVQSVGGEAVGHGARGGGAQHSIERYICGRQTRAEAVARGQGLLVQSEPEQCKAGAANGGELRAAADRGDLRDSGQRGGAQSEVCALSEWDGTSSAIGSLYGEM